MSHNPKLPPWLYPSLGSRNFPSSSLLRSHAARSKQVPSQQASKPSRNFLISIDSIPSVLEPKHHNTSRTP